jgi:hypothetical protein
VKWSTPQCSILKSFKNTWNLSKNKIIILRFARNKLSTLIYAIFPRIHESWHMHWPWEKKAISNNSFPFRSPLVPIRAQNFIPTLLGQIWKRTNPTTDKDFITLFMNKFTLYARTKNLYLYHLTDERRNWFRWY